MSSSVNKEVLEFLLERFQIERKKSDDYYRAKDVEEMNGNTGNCTG